MTKRVLATAAALVLPFAGTAAAASMSASAATAAQTAPATISPNWTAGDEACGAPGDAPCMISNQSTLGDAVQASDGFALPDAQMEVTDNYACSGGDTVTENCPFNRGSGLNAKFDGKKIVTLSSYGTGWSYAGIVDASGVADVVTKTSGSGQLWVQVDETGGWTSWINVWYSDQKSAPQEVCTPNSIPGRLIFEKWSQNSNPYSCEWGETG
jgi:hypothetical protein